MVAQRVYWLALGYEDLSDHDQLREDPLLAVLSGKARVGEAPLAGKSMLNRLELGGEQSSRYKKIRYRPARGGRSGSARSGPRRRQTWAKSSKPTPKKNSSSAMLQGSSLTRDGVAYLLGKHVRRAAETLPQLRARRITPYTMRHSRAVALLQAGVEVCNYLGHAPVATTSRYIATNLEMKRAGLEAFWQRAGLAPGPNRRRRPSTKLLAFLGQGGLSGMLTPIGLAAREKLRAGAR